MRLKRLIKYFPFDESVRKDITLGENTRLNPKTHAIELKPAGNGQYPTTADLHVRTWITNPNSVRQWLGFECVITNAVDSLRQEVTGAGFRLSDGTNEYWHDGAAWVINTTDWNTEEEVAAAIPTFSAATKKIQVVINLYTTAATYTPSITSIKILYSSDIKHHEDYIYRTLVRHMKQEIRPIARFPVTMAADSNTIDMSAQSIDTPYEIVGIDAVFDHTNDSDHVTDLYLSFDDPSQVITLNTSISAGAIAWVEFIYKPDVTVEADAEYYELSKIPAIIVDDYNMVNQVDLAQDDSVINKGDGTAVKVVAPKRADINITLSVVTSSSIDQTRLADEVRRYFADNPLMVSWGLGDKFRMRFLGDYDKQASTPTKGIHTGKFRCMLMGALFYEREAVDSFAVTTLKITGGNVNVDID